MKYKNIQNNPDFNSNDNWDFLFQLKFVTKYSKCR